MCIVYIAHKKASLDILTRTTFKIHPLVMKNCSKNTQTRTPMPINLCMCACRLKTD